MTQRTNKQGDTLNDIPSVISTRTAGLEPLLKAWREKNKGVSWSKLIDSGLKKELAPLAGKRHAHLVEGN